ncbi:MAG: DNA-directed RNA polymerase subunit alpha [Anaerolineaceae bacterium]|nr:DNA-directed RNA polymerase subunit alpha [Anaerolineae bacterium]MBL1172605.1 DNA-directed RNA polymerase subunit alpha [Chloroflexota bacterium]MBV6466506.1 DNA-directed RNA polymerase subunit alpha [Anaerolineales bacterium]MCE7904694.1 DNA-directed RNA polymerase subunit alpha [Anaerolineae bacterium CFX3]MDL1926376.1 DNA-directed RNA polymerase subunit alpha [Anaerolineae bacterium AMX1]GER81016.1 DNA-directed RNA polymerase subunit alpha [Candidatus Denitrolinea symbiosum]GJQ38121.1 
MTGITNMVMPKIEREAEARNYGKFIISPLERGYGVTVGNALRRVLLSSLDGAAVTSIRILDVLHEFSDIPGVREDVIQVTLQVKQLRMKLDGVDSARMHLEVRGEGTVTAADIIAPPEIEIVNPDLFLFTVDSPKAKLDIEFMVERGRGYSPANERSGHTPIGELPVDAIFSPVKRVNWEVGSARVGQSTNYDKLTLEIWTDGAISPERALSAASRALIDQLRFIAGISEETLTIPLEKEVAGGRITSEVAETPVEALDLSVRVFNSLKRTGITNVGDVLDLLEKGEQAVMSIRNFGEKSLDELRQKMREKGYLKDDTTSAE